MVLCNTTPLNWNGRWKPYCCPRPNAEPSQTRLYLFFLLPSRFIVCGTWQLLCGGTTSSFTASEGTPYAHIHVLIPPYQFHLLTLLSFLAGPPRFTPALNSAHSYQHASSHLSPGHSFSPPSLLHSTLQRTFPYPIPTLFRSSRPHIFPHASRPAASPRRTSHSRKSQSHSLQVFSGDLGPWPCFVPSESMCRVFDRAPLLSFGVAYVANL